MSWYSFAMVIKDHEDREVDREERWFERGIKEDIYVKRERPSRVHVSL